MISKKLLDKSVTKFNAVDTKIPITRGLVTKTHYKTVGQSLERKIEDVDNKGTKLQQDG